MQNFVWTSILITVKLETLTNPHCKSFDKIYFDKLLDIFIEKVYIDLLKFGESTRIHQCFRFYGNIFKTRPVEDGVQVS